MYMPVMLGALLAAAALALLSAERVIFAVLGERTAPGRQTGWRPTRSRVPPCARPVMPAPLAGAMA